jgi:hypothetical protein
MDCRNYYRRYLKKMTTNSGQSGSITIPKWKYAEEMSFVPQYLCERDNVTYLQFEENYERYEEELLQAESEHGGAAEQEEQTVASSKIKLKNKINL